MSHDWLDKVVVLHRVGVREHEDTIVDMIHCNSFADFPTVGGVNAHGDRAHWAAHLAKLATPEQTAEYWRARAVLAEAKLPRNRESWPSSGILTAHPVKGEGADQ